MASYTDIIVLEDRSIKLQFDDNGDLIDQEIRLKNYEDVNLNGETFGLIE